VADDLYPGERGDDYPTSPEEQARLSQLIPAAEARARAILAAMALRGMPAYVGETARSQAEQDAAVASGHSSANEHHDWHMLKRAVDFRKRLPGDHADPTTHDEAFFRALYEEATIAGCRSLAFHPDGTKLLIHTVHGDVWDAGHVEYREPYLSLADAFAAEGTAVA
jgi:hypothetical protein